MSDLESRFQEAVEKVRNAPEDGGFKPSNDYKLKMYALYRQATDGDVQGKKPGMLNPIARYKWQAWADMKGKNSEQAMQEYIAEVDKVEAEYG
ncbi:acyl-coA-binding protein, ACBP [Salinisphaera sp. C84B14]|jgi:acyl-CoA-binding protein|uniref:acyl-CoA-binding protein n=1 Tax=Salinisphaera sp. C84B14 TaxID=1304155 RepID=UPI0032B289E3|tara:strand:- start:597 stop:875 length:279 start_codon:yes stop_codon:yes gene_type:complete